MQYGSYSISGWEGQKKDEFMELFSEFKKEMKIFHLNLEDFKSTLEGTRQNAESLYDEGKALSNNL